MKRYILTRSCGKEIHVTVPDGGPSDGYAYTTPGRKADARDASTVQKFADDMCGTPSTVPCDGALIPTASDAAPFTFALAT